MRKPTYPLGTDFKGTFPWRTSHQIRGVRSKLQAAMNLVPIGARTITLDLVTAGNLIEICRQAAHTEDGYTS